MVSLVDLLSLFLFSVYIHFDLNLVLGHGGVLFGTGGMA